MGSQESKINLITQKDKKYKKHKRSLIKLMGLRMVLASTVVIGIGKKWWKILDYKNDKRSQGQRSGCMRRNSIKIHLNSPTIP
jgi:hypothetical protein